jgi:hypothetical protein
LDAILNECRKHKYQQAKQELRHTDHFPRSVPWIWQTRIGSRRQPAVPRLIAALEPRRVSLFLALGWRRKRRLRIRLPLGEACIQQALQTTVRGWETFIGVGSGRSEIYRAERLRDRIEKSRQEQEVKTLKIMQIRPECADGELLLLV